MAALEFHPLTPDRWADLEALFGDRGACGGCWCMWWRIPRPHWTWQKGAGNKKALKRIVETGPPPGILAYAGGQPIAWCAVSPRDNYPVLNRSRTLQRIDDQPVWSVTCFFVTRPFRRKGVTTKLLKAAVEYARSKGARIVEGYPVEPRKKEIPDAFAWTGFASAFRRAGFREAARRSPTRPIMRRPLGALGRSF